MVKTYKVIILIWNSFYYNRLALKKCIVVALKNLLLRNILLLSVDNSIILKPLGATHFTNPTRIPPGQTKPGTLHQARRRNGDFLLLVHFFFSNHMDSLHLSGSFNANKWTLWTIENFYLSLKFCQCHCHHANGNFLYFLPIWLSQEPGDPRRKPCWRYHWDGPWQRESWGRTTSEGSYKVTWTDS